MNGAAAGKDADSVIKEEIAEREPGGVPVVGF